MMKPSVCVKRRRTVGGAARRHRSSQHPVADMAAEMDMAFLLEDLRVIDISTHIAGPFCAKLLADMGAEVIKVERPGTGDPARKMGPFPGDAADPEASGHFLYLNTSKLGMTLDLSQAEGREIFLRLAQTADLVVESFPPGTMEALGLGFNSLRRANQKLVLVSITPFGQTGPYRDYKGSDLIGYAMGGLMWITGEPEKPPVVAGGHQAYHFSGVMAAFHALVAHTHARLTGEGQHVDVSVQECIAGILEVTTTDYQYTGNVRKRMGTRHPLAHGLGIPRLKDGTYLFTSNFPEPHMWDKLIEFLGDPAWADDPRCKDFRSRREHADQMDRIGQEAFKDYRVEDVYYPMQKMRAPVAPVNTVKTLLESAQLRERAFFREMDHPVAGKQTYFTLPFKLSTGEGGPCFRAPLLGEHNRLIYEERLQMSPERLEDLARQGVI